MHRTGEGGSQHAGNEKAQLDGYLRNLVKGNPSLQSVYNQMFAAFTA